MYFRTLFDFVLVCSVCVLSSVSLAGKTAVSAEAAVVPVYVHRRSAVLMDSGSNGNDENIAPLQFPLRLPAMPLVTAAAVAAPSALGSAQPTAMQLLMSKMKQRQREQLRQPIRLLGPTADSAAVVNQILWNADIRPNDGTLKRSSAGRVGAHAEPDWLLFSNF